MKVTFAIEKDLSQRLLHQIEYHCMFIQSYLHCHPYHRLPQYMGNVMLARGAPWPQNLPPPNRLSLSHKKYMKPNPVDQKK